MLKSLIFDFNGTMFFDGQIQKASWRTFLAAEFGCTLTDAEFNEHIAGRNNRHTFTYFAGHDFDDHTLAELAEREEQRYRAACLAHPAVFHLVAGLPELLTRCQQDGMQLNIATASEAPNVDFFFEHLQLARWFDRDRVVLNDGHLPGKPAPDMFLQAMHQINAVPATSAIFEDSASGIVAANRAHAGQVVLVEDPQLPSMAMPVELRIDATIHDYHQFEL